MSKTYLKVTKDDGTIHIVEKSIESQIKAQNNLRPSNRKWTIEEVSEEEAKNQPWKETNFVPAAAKAVVAEKDAKIAELQKKLAEAEAKANANPADSNAGNDEKFATGVNATDAIAVIGTMQTVEEVNTYLNGDTRATVVKAANAKIAELEKAN